MWLLDVNMPRQVVDKLGVLRIEAHAAESRGWGQLGNGQLVEAAIAAGFTCLLTRDRLFGQSAARALKRFPGFCVVVVTIPQLRGPEFIAEFELQWGAAPIKPEAGNLIYWPGE
jgi:hypothetical protein